MRKTGLFAIAAVALILVGVGDGARPTPWRRVSPLQRVLGSTPFQVMTNAKYLATEHYQDFSVIFH